MLYAVSKVKYKDEEAALTNVRKDFNPPGTEKKQKGLISVQFLKVTDGSGEYY